MRGDRAGQGGEYMREWVVMNVVGSLFVDVVGWACCFIAVVEVERGSVGFGR